MDLVSLVWTDTSEEAKREPSKSVRLGDGRKFHQPGRFGRRKDARRFRLNCDPFQTPTRILKKPSPAHSELEESRKPANVGSLGGRCLSP